jgi:hypothetical protein
MTITENPHDTGWTSVNDTGTSRPLWRRPAVLGTAAAVLVAAVGAGALLMSDEGPTGPGGPATAPATLPDKVAGLEQADSKTAEGLQKAFEEKAQKLGDVTVVGRTYTSENKRRTIKVVVGRTDLTRKLDLAWVADKGREAGDARCTSNLKLTPESKPSVRKTMLLCWRTTDTLSAYSLIIDFDKTPKDADGVAALTEAWNAA